MKLSVSQLRRIIKEEVSRMLVMEVVYEDPYEEENGYSDPRFGDEPPGYKPPKAKDVPDLKGKFKAWYEQLKVDRPEFLKNDFRAIHELEIGEHYRIVGNKLYLKPSLYDAIDNQVGKMKELKALVPGGVVRGLPEAGGFPMSESRRRTNRRR